MIDPKKIFTPDDFLRERHRELVKRQRRLNNTVSFGTAAICLAIAIALVWVLA